MSVTSLGRRLLQARLAHAAKLGRPISQSEIARDLNVTGVSVGRWEADKKEPDLKTIAELARIYGVSAGWLAFGEGEGDAVTLGRPVGLDTVARAVSRQNEAFRKVMAGGPPPLSRGTDFYEAGEARARIAEIIHAIAELISAVFTGADQEPGESPVARQFEAAMMSRLNAAESALELVDLERDLMTFSLDLQDASQANPVAGLRLSSAEVLAFVEGRWPDLMASTGKHVAARVGEGMPTEEEIADAARRSAGDFARAARRLLRMRHSREPVEKFREEARKAARTEYLHWASLIDNPRERARALAEVGSWEIQLKHQIGDLKDTDEIFEFVQDKIRDAADELSSRNRLNPGPRVDPSAEETLVKATPPKKRPRKRKGA